MTAKGLFLTLQKCPGRDPRHGGHGAVDQGPRCPGRPPLGPLAQPGHDRVVTWTTATDGPQRFVFRGGLILISNRPLADLPELRALATRIEVHRLEVTDAELAALMRELAGKGYRLEGKVGIGPEECLKVTEYLLKECRAAGCPLDLRLQQKAFQSYLQFAADCSVSHWEDLIAASVREATCHFRHEPNTTSPEARKAKRRNVIREIIGKDADAKEQERALHGKDRVRRGRTSSAASARSRAASSTKPTPRSCRSLSRQRLCSPWFQSGATAREMGPGGADDWREPSPN